MPPKQWKLTKDETYASFDNWRTNQLLWLDTDARFKPFLQAECQWTRKSVAKSRGFVADRDGLSAAEKASLLELMIGQIAGHIDVISRIQLINNSTSIANIWHMIKAHYGFQSSGALFLDLADFKLEDGEKPQDLFQRLQTFMDTNLLTKDDPIKHHGSAMLEDEPVTPTVENFVVLTWLKLLNPNLPKLVKQKYGTELRSNTLASLKDEISAALPSLIDEVESNAKIYKLSMQRFPSQRFPEKKRGPSTYPATNQAYQAQKGNSQGYRKSCPICAAKGINDNHNLSMCPHLPDRDKKFMMRLRKVQILFDDSEPEEDVDDEDHVAVEDDDDGVNLAAAVNRVQVRPSPSLNACIGNENVTITFDTGATGDIMSEKTAHRINAKIKPACQLAGLADGNSNLNVCGETKFPLTIENKQFLFEGLVAKNLDAEIIAGVPFMEKYDITIRPGQRQIIFPDGCIYYYNPRCTTKPVIRSIEACKTIVRAPETNTTLWPGESLQLDLPGQLAHLDEVAMEPRLDSPLCKDTPISQLWPAPTILVNSGGRVTITNNTTSPKFLKKNEHFCQLFPTIEYDDVIIRNVPVVIPEPEKPPKHIKPFYKQVHLDPDGLLTPTQYKNFESTLIEFDEVFNPDFPGYNGAFGQIEAVVNIGPTQPQQRRGRVPLYDHKNLVRLQQKCDILESQHVLAKPEEVGVYIEQVSPSFLIGKPNGDDRYVTAFDGIAQYCRPQPSLLPNTETTLRTIGRWKFTIKCDLIKSFYQLPVAKSSMKYLGVATPFRGLRVYTRAAMGIPGSETVLEELMCRVFGDLVQEQLVAKVADDLYCGADTPEQLLVIWREILSRLAKASLRLSAPKTVICPKSTTILGWTWTMGTFTASKHRIPPLATCAPPETVSALRSYIGAYKFIARTIPNCASYLAPLEDLLCNPKSKKDKIMWSESSTSAFQRAQTHLTKTKSLVIPKSTDTLWIVTDGAVKTPGLGATLYVTRDGGTPKVAGYFSAKLRKRQLTWIPCEVEALAISSAVRHWAPFIIESENKVCVLTDSKPCVQALDKLRRGEYSFSSRVSTFLATASRYQISIRHLAGKVNKVSDFASRNAPDCNEPSCQICLFIQQSEDCVVRPITCSDVLTGNATLPYISRQTWLQIQQESTGIRNAIVHKQQGTRPSKKRKAPTVKHYVNNCTVAADGLLVVKSEEPMAPTRERIVVPRDMIDGLLTALHIQLGHPSENQLKLASRRFFYAIDMDGAVNRVSKGCTHCEALRKVPRRLIEQSSTAPPANAGLTFATDVLRREGQFILTLRETVTSFSVACFVPNERHESLRDGLIKLALECRPIDGPRASIRSDPAPGLSCLVNDKTLNKFNLELIIGEPKNVNKNPVAERCIQELEEEICKLDFGKRKLTPLELAIAMSRMNERIRLGGLSAREKWCQRDQFTNQQLPISDAEMIKKQYASRVRNHPVSARSKSHGTEFSPKPELEPGELVYLYSDKDKHLARARYLVVTTSPDGLWCKLRKFSGFQLRARTYSVRQSDCYRVPIDTRSRRPPLVADSSDESSDEEYVHQPPPPHINDPPMQHQPPYINDPPIPAAIEEPDIPAEPPPLRPRRTIRLPVALNDYELDKP